MYRKTKIRNDAIISPVDNYPTVVHVRNDVSAKRCDIVAFCVPHNFGSHFVKVVS